MSKKFPKPFFVKARGVWRVQIQGRQYNLGPDEAEAWNRYHELIARPPEVATDLVVGIIEGFLEWCQRRVDQGERTPRTYKWYKQHLQSFVDWLPAPQLD